MFDLVKMAVILDLTQYAILRVLSGHTTMSSVPENLKIDTKGLFSVENYTNWMFKWPNGGSSWKITAILNVCLANVFFQNKTAWWTLIPYLVIVSFYHPRRWFNAETTPCMCPVRDICWFIQQRPQLPYSLDNVLSLQYIYIMNY